jgi:hypothetical protein
MSNRNPRRELAMKWVLRIVAVLVLLVVIAVVAVYFSLNGIIKSAVQTAGTQATGVQTTLDGVNLSPFSGSLDLNNLQIKNPEGFTAATLFQLGQANVQVQPGSLMSDTLQVDKLHLDGTNITVAFQDGKLNIKEVLDHLKQFSGGGSDTTQDTSGGKDVIVRDIRISNTKLTGTFDVIKGADPVIIATEIPTIEIAQIGGADGVPMPQLISQLLTTILSQSMDKLVQTQGFGQVTAALGEQAQQQIEAATKQADEAIQDATSKANQAIDDANKKLNEGLGNLLGGKKKEPAEEEKQ